MDHAFGPCCACGSESGAANFITLDFEGPEGFIGWGCMRCGVPSRGAVALVCASCLQNQAAPKFICGGKYISEKVRVPLEGFERKPFGHVTAKHPEFTLH